MLFVRLYVVLFFGGGGRRFDEFLGMVVCYGGRSVMGGVFLW